MTNYTNCQINIALLRIGCDGTTHKQCSSIRKILWKQFQNELVDLYLVSKPKKNDGFCMVANMTGTEDSLNKIRNDIEKIPHIIKTEMVFGI